MTHDPDLAARVDDLSRRIEAIERVIAGRSEAVRRTFEPVRREPAPVRVRAPLAPAAKAKTDPTGEQIERFVGARVFAVLGALVVVAGAALFLKLAWDQGWLNLIPDVAKCLASGAFGALLLGVGELARRKWGAWASIGCTGAGVGVLYATAYAAYGVFGLVGHATGFALLAASAALGIATGARARQASIAALSMIGALLVPLFFVDVPTGAYVLPSYLLMLLVVGLALSAWLGRGFAALRAVAWWGVVLLGASWVQEWGRERLWLPLVFLGAAWALVHAELVVSAVRRGLGAEGPAAVVPLAWRATRPVALALSTSAWATVLAVWVLGRHGVEQWFAPAAGAAACAALALWLGDGLSVLRLRPTGARDRLAALMAVQAGAFVIAATALGLADWAQVVAWFGLGACAVGLGRWLRARGLDFYGLCVLMIGAGRLLLHDRFFTDTAASGLVWRGLFVSDWTRLALAGAGAWIVSGALLRREDDPWRVWLAAARGAVGVGVALVMLSVLHERSEWASVCLTWLAVSALVFAAHWVARWACARVGAILVALCAVVPWMLAYPMERWDSFDAALGLHPGLGLAGLVVAMLLVTGIVVRRRGDGGEFGAVLGAAGIVAAGVVALGATSLEVARAAETLTSEVTAQRAAVSIWWGLFAVGLLVFGLVRRLGPVRYAGLGLLGVATLKAVLFDLQGVPAGWRVASFLSLGVLMLGVGLVYARSAARGREAAREGGA